jgi:hypothetical protein
VSKLTPPPPPPPSRPGILFVEDIFIVKEADNKPEIYHLTEESWKGCLIGSEEDLTDRVVAKLQPLIRTEVIIADVPAIAGDPPYLFINLTALAVNKD